MSTAKRKDDGKDEAAKAAMSDAEANASGADAQDSTAHDSSHSDGGDGSSSTSSSDSGSSSDSSSEGEEEEEKGSQQQRKPLSEIKFRNYKPFSQKLHPCVVPPAPVLADFNWVDEEIRSIIEKAHAPAAPSSSGAGAAGAGKGDQSVLNLVPKPVDWDLKRLLAPKMEILQARTQRAIVELVQARINAEQGS